MKNLIFALSFSVLALSSIASAEPDPITIYSCVGDNAKTLPSSLSVTMSQRKITVGELKLSASRLFKNQPANKRTYVSKSVYSSSETNVLEFIYDPSPNGSGVLTVTTPSPIGTLSKTYACAVVAQQG